MIKEILKLRICQNSEEDKLGKVLDNTFKISAAGVLTGGLYLQ